MVKESGSGSLAHGFGALGNARYLAILRMRYDTEALTATHIIFEAYLRYMILKLDIFGI